MNRLSLALYCEGSTDNRFLPPIIEKTARSILDEHRQNQIVESIAKPKLKLKNAVRRAYASRSKRRRESDIDFLYEPMGQSISMSRLKQVPSYQQFVDDLTEVLIALRFIPTTHII